MNQDIVIYLAIARLTLSLSSCELKFLASCFCLFISLSSLVRSSSWLFISLSFWCSSYIANFRCCFSTLFFCFLVSRSTMGLESSWLAN